MTLPGGLARSRSGRVNIIYLQNGYGKPLVVPFSIRSSAGARVSTPLTWDEVRAELDAERFNIGNVLERMRRLGVDPMSPVLSKMPIYVGLWPQWKRKCTICEAGEALFGPIDSAFFEPETRLYRSGQGGAWVPMAHF